MTLNQLFRIIENYASGHSNINTIVFGAKWNIDNKDADGVMLWYDVQAGVIDRTMLSYGFELYFLDVLNPDDSNLKDVLSDTLQVAQDMAAMLYNYDCEEEFDLPKRATIQPVQYKFTSDYAGHSLTFTIEAPYEWNDCQVPVRDGYSFECRDMPTPNCDPVTIYDNEGNEVGEIVSGGILTVIAKDTGGVEIDCTYTLANGILTLSNINVIHMVQFTGVTTTLTNAAFANKPITDFIVLISGTDWVTSGNATKITASSTITLDTDVGGGIANVIY